MSYEFTCEDCGLTMDQSDSCSHASKCVVPDVGELRRRIDHLETALDACIVEAETAESPRDMQHGVISIARAALKRSEER